MKFFVLASALFVALAAAAPAGPSEPADPSNFGEAGDEAQAVSDALAAAKAAGPTTPSDGPFQSTGPDDVLDPSLNTVVHNVDKTLGSAGSKLGLF